MRPCSGASGGTQREGNEGPKIGMSAEEMCEQKVVQTARAQEYGIQYPKRKKEVSSVDRNIRLVSAVENVNSPCAARAPPVIL